MIFYIFITSIGIALLGVALDTCS